MKIDRILCPVDFSDASVHAVQQAVAFAGWYKSKITALHVYTPFYVPVAELPVSTDPVSTAELQRVRDETLACVRSAGTGGDIDVVVTVGHPAAAILEHAATLRADLVVMGTHGAGGFEHFMLGSVAEKVLRKAACPVLTVPPRARSTAVLPFKRLLCAVDFSASSLSAAQSALSIAAESGAALTLVHVLEWPWHEPPAPALETLPPDQGRALAEYRRYLEKSAMNRLQTLVPDESSRVPTTALLRHGKAYVEILAQAAADAADLIVVGVHGRNVFDLMLFGSTTNQIVRQAGCPVLTLKR